VAIDTNYKIHAALVQHYESVAATGLPTAYPNRKFEQPTAESPWAELFVIPIDTIPFTQGGGGQDITEGILQINLNYEVNQGHKDSILMGDKVAYAFRAGQYSVYDGVQVNFRGASLLQGRVVNGWWQVVVSARFYCVSLRS